MTEEPVEIALPMPLVTVLPRELETALLVEVPMPVVFAWLKPRVLLRDWETLALAPLDAIPGTPAEMLTPSVALTPAVIDSFAPNVCDSFALWVSVLVSALLDVSAVASLLESVVLLLVACVALLPAWLPALTPALTPMVADDPMESLRWYV